MTYKKGDMLQIKPGSCLVLEASINAYDFFKKIYYNGREIKHPIYSISSDVGDRLFHLIWEKEETVLERYLKPQILYMVLYGDTKVAILDSEVLDKIDCSVATERINIDNV